MKALGLSFLATTSSDFIFFLNTNIKDYAYIKKYTVILKSNISSIIQ